MRRGSPRAYKIQWRRVLWFNPLVPVVYLFSCDGTHARARERVRATVSANTAPAISQAKECAGDIAGDTEQRPKTAHGPPLQLCSCVLTPFTSLDVTVSGAAMGDTGKGKVRSSAVAAGTHQCSGTTSTASYPVHLLAPLVGCPVPPCHGCRSACLCSPCSAEEEVGS